MFKSDFITTKILPKSIELLRQVDVICSCALMFSFLMLGAQLQITMNFQYIVGGYLPKLFTHTQFGGYWALMCMQTIAENKWPCDLSFPLLQFSFPGNVDHRLHECM